MDKSKDHQMTIQVDIQKGTEHQYQTSVSCPTCVQMTYGTQLVLPPANGHCGVLQKNITAAL